MSPSAEEPGSGFQGSRKRTLEHRGPKRPSGRFGLRAAGINPQSDDKCLMQFRREWTGTDRHSRCVVWRAVTRPEKHAVSLDIEEDWAVRPHWRFQSASVAVTPRWWLTRLWILYEMVAFEVWYHVTYRRLRGVSVTRARSLVFAHIVLVGSSERLDRYLTTDRRRKIQAITPLRKAQAIARLGCNSATMLVR